MTHIELNVEGMTCGGCTSRIKRVLEAENGVKVAEGVVETGIVSVDFDAASITEGAIRTLIEDAGFDVV